MDVLASMIENQVFGVAKKSKGIAVGILGLGPNASYSLVGPTVVGNMARQGLISSAAFSLSIGHRMSNTGEIGSCGSSKISLKTPRLKPPGFIIFGGINTKKYMGTLEEISFLHKRIPTTG